MSFLRLHNVIEESMNKVAAKKVEKKSLLEKIEFLENEGEKKNEQIRQLKKLVDHLQSKVKNYTLILTILIHIHRWIHKKMSLKSPAETNWHFLTKKLANNWRRKGRKMET